MLQEEQQGIKVKYTVDQRNQEVGEVYQADQIVKGRVCQCRQIVLGYLEQDNQYIEKTIYQVNQQFGKLYQKESDMPHIIFADKNIILNEMFKYRKTFNSDIHKKVIRNIAENKRKGGVNMFEEDNKTSYISQDRIKTFLKLGQDMSIAYDNEQHEELKIRRMNEVLIKLLETHIDHMWYISGNSDEIILKIPGKYEFQKEV